MDIYRKKHKKGKDVTYVPDTEHDRNNPKMGRRLDKFLVSEDLNIKETTITHVSDNVYKQELNMVKKFDHGADRLSYNKKKSKVGPGQLDTYLIKTDALDSVIKEVIYEANIHNANIPEITETYIERNRIVTPLLKKLLEINMERKTMNDPAIREDEQEAAIDIINKQDEKLPTMAQLHEINKEISDRVLTEIQNGIIVRVQKEQKALKKKASNELRDITRKLNNMNLKLENNPTVAERQEIAKTQELYNAKYTAFFKRETENQIMFRPLNLEKPTKWFMNLANDQKDTESPALKLRKYCEKYKKHS